MDRSMDDRLARLVQRVRWQRDNDRPHENLDRQHRLARARVLDEIPRFISRLTSCTSDLNDRLGDDGVWLTITVAERTPTTEAALIVDLDYGDGAGTSEVFNVDYAGKLTCMLIRESKRSLIVASTVFEADNMLLMTCLLELLEAAYPPRHSQ